MLGTAVLLSLLSASSLVDALPTTVVGAFPSVTNADGTVNQGLFRRNVEQTFAKYDFKPAVSTSMHKKRCTTGCDSSASTVHLDLITQQPAAGLYTVDVKIGTPAQSLPLLIDTGSTDLFVQSACAQGSRCASNYLGAKSSTGTATSETATLSYVSDSVSGKIVTDTVSIGGKTVEQQSFLVVEDSHTPGAAGNVGLGLNAHSNPKFGTPLVENLRASGQLGADNAFSVQLDRTGNNAVLTLGATVPPYFARTHAVQYPELLGRWALQLLSVQANSRSAAGSWSGPGLVVFMDTGAGSNFLPRGAAKAAHLNANATVETIQQTLQGQTYDVDYYFYPCDQDWSYSVLFGPTRSLTHAADKRDLSVGSDGNGMCQSALAGVDIEYNGLKAGILGAQWMKSKLMYFNAGTDANNSGAKITIMDYY